MLSNPMSRALPLTLAVAAVAAAALACPAQAASASATAKTFEGVWKVTKVVITGPNARTDSNPQPSLAMFARGYYSILRDNSRGPRKTTLRAKSPGKPTDAEKIAKYEEWAPYSASAGTYEVKGDTLITHNVVAKQASGMTATELATFKFVGDTFVLRPPPGPDAPPGETVERTYTRVR
jgi:hypothetical protein